jgi:predicted nucleotidyltransferase
LWRTGPGLVDTALIHVSTTKERRSSAVSSRGELERRIRRELGHLPEDEVCALTRILERLIEAYEPEQIYLFGSKARGDQGPDSDFDLMVVVAETAPAERKRSRLAYERLWGTGTAADVLVWTRERFDSRIHLRASLPGTILREGRLLYAA